MLLCAICGGETRKADEDELIYMGFDIADDVDICPICLVSGLNGRFSRYAAKHEHGGVWRSIVYPVEGSFIEINIDYSGGMSIGFLRLDDMVLQGGSPYALYDTSIWLAEPLDLDFADQKGVLRKVRTFLTWS